MDTISNRFDMDKASGLLIAMGNPKRLAILGLLIQGEMAVGKLADAVGLSQSALSQHLAKLRLAGLVTTRRDAQSIYYSSQSAEVARVVKILDEIYAGEASNHEIAS